MTLEELGIGRPSTYSPTITTLLARRYIVKENKNLYMTELGEAVNELIVKRISFHSRCELYRQHGVAVRWCGRRKGKVEDHCGELLSDLNEAVEAAEKELAEVKIADEVSDEIL